MLPWSGRNWTVLGIDPGAQPTICVLWNQCRSVRFYDGKDLCLAGGDTVTAVGKTPKGGMFQFDPRKVAAVLEWAQPHLVTVESVWVRPHQGVASQAKLVYSMGNMIGMCAALHYNVLFLRPETWTKYHGLQVKATRGQRSDVKEVKGRRKVAALELAPDLLAPFLTRRRDHNRADAFLMAYIGMRLLDNTYQRGLKKGFSTDWTPEIWTVK